MIKDLFPKNETAYFFSWKRSSKSKDNLCTK